MTHGGPRPNQTGRPPKAGPTVVKCSISMYPEEWARLDKLRGEMSRSRWIAERVRRAKGIDSGLATD